MVHIDPGDLCGIFFYFAICTAENGRRSGFQILFVAYGDFFQIQIFHPPGIHDPKNAIFTVFRNFSQDIIGVVSDQPGKFSRISFFSFPDSQNLGIIKISVCNT